MRPLKPSLQSLTIPSVLDADRSSYRDPLVQVLHVAVVQGNAAARAMRIVVNAAAVDVDFAAQPGVLRRHSLRANGRQNLPVFIGADQARGQTALGLLGIGIADA